MYSFIKTILRLTNVTYRRNIVREVSVVSGTPQECVLLETKALVIMIHDLCAVFPIMINDFYSFFLFMIFKKYLRSRIYFNILADTAKLSKMPSTKETESGKQMYYFFPSLVIKPIKTCLQYNMIVNIAA